MISRCPFLHWQVESDRGEVGTDGIVNPNVELTHGSGECAKSYGKAEHEGKTQVIGAK
jgi:hypothetical protein